MKVLSSFARCAFASFFTLTLSLGEARATTPTALPPACTGHDLAEGVDLRPALARRADDLVNGQGLLWRIERDGIAPSYLYGTIHTSDADAIALANEAAKLIDAAKVVATELGAPLDPVDKAQMAGEMVAQAVDHDNDTLAGTLPAADSAFIDAYLTKRGFPSAFAHHLKLWFLAVMTSLPECETKRAAFELPVVDDVMAKTGKDLGLPVIGLETIKEQMDIMASLPNDVSATLLEQNARKPTLSDDAFVTMLRLYREKRPAEILAIVDSLPDLTPEERSAQEIFVQRMIGRNTTMAKRADPLLAAGGAFIAVGALHLPGKQGLIELFRAAGYKVTNVW